MRSSDRPPGITRISIASDVSGALGFVAYGDPAHRYVVTRNALLDTICTLFGGREAECLLYDDVSLGAGQDLERASAIARDLVERQGLAGKGSTLDGQVFAADKPVSDNLRFHLEAATKEILDQQRDRARKIVHEHRTQLESLRDLLIERKVLDLSTHGR